MKHLFISIAEFAAAVGLIALCFRNHLIQVPDVLFIGLLLGLAVTRAVAAGIELAQRAKG